MLTDRFLGNLLSGEEVVKVLVGPVTTIPEHLIAVYKVLKAVRDVALSSSA
jgi:hypothetical protein